MLLNRLSMAGAILMSSLGSAPVLALGLDEEMRLASLPRDVFSRDAGVPTLAPFAHVVFCKSQPAECRNDGRGEGVVAWTPTLGKLLSQVNTRVNRAIRPVHDGGGPLDDAWTLSPREGDCDDYAVTKRFELARAGVPSGALRLVIARTAKGEGHAVLMVRTDRGDFVLDNLTDRIREWRDTRLTMIKLQSGTDPRRWFSFGGRNLASRD